MVLQRLVFISLKSVVLIFMYKWVYVHQAAVHQLVKSIGTTKGGLPTGGRAYGILPVTLDTPMNRKWMKHDHTWTPLEHVAE